MKIKLFIILISLFISQLNAGNCRSKNVIMPIEPEETNEVRTQVRVVHIANAAIEEHRVMGDLYKHINPNREDSFTGLTPVDTCIKTHNFETLKFLIAKANLEKLNKYGATPLCYALLVRDDLFGYRRSLRCKINNVTNKIETLSPIIHPNATIEESRELDLFCKANKRLDELNNLYKQNQEDIELNAKIINLLRSYNAPAINAFGEWYCIKE